MTEPRAHLFNHNGEFGDAHQHVSKTNTSCYIWFVVDSPVETANDITFTLGAAFYYGGSENYIPYEIGIKKMYEDGTSANIPQTAVGYWKPMNTLGTDANGDWAWIWAIPHSGSLTFTIPKEERPFKILPFFKIGYIEYVDGHYTPYESYHYPFTGNADKIGLLCIYAAGATMADGRIAEDKGLFMRRASMTYEGVSLDASIFFAGVNDWKTVSYNNGLYRVGSIYENPFPIFVANQNGEYQRASGLWVYDNERKPRQIVSITRYDENRHPQTIYC